MNICMSPCPDCGRYALERQTDDADEADCFRCGAHVTADEIRENDAACGLWAMDYGL